SLPPCPGRLPRPPAPPVILVGQLLLARGWQGRRIAPEQPSRHDQGQGIRALPEQRPRVGARGREIERLGGHPERRLRAVDLESATPTLPLKLPEPMRKILGLLEPRPEARFVDADRHQQHLRLRAPVRFAEELERRDDERGRAWWRGDAARRISPAI